MSESSEKDRAPNDKTAETPARPQNSAPEKQKLDGVELDDIELVEIKAFA